MFNKKSLGIRHLNRKHFSLDKFPHFAFRVKYSSGGVWIPVKGSVAESTCFVFQNVWLCGFLRLLFTRKKIPWMCGWGVFFQFLFGWLGARAERHTRVVSDCAERNCTWRLQCVFFNALHHKSMTCPNTFFHLPANFIYIAMTFLFFFWPSDALLCCYWTRDMTIILSVVGSLHR